MWMWMCASVGGHDGGWRERGRGHPTRAIHFSCAPPTPDYRLPSPESRRERRGEAMIAGVPFAAFCFEMEYEKWYVCPRRFGFEARIEENTLE